MLGSLLTFTVFFQGSVCLFRHQHHTVSFLMSKFDDLLWAPVLLLRPLLSGSPSLYLCFGLLLQLKPLSSVSSCECRAPFVHLSLSCQVLWAFSFYVNVAADFLPRGDSLSLTALAAHFTSNLLSLSSTAESCKCHYRFCHHHHHQRKHHLLPFPRLLFRANEVAADVQNRGFICRVSKVIPPVGQFMS